jgi:hypothetical protein
MQVLGTLDGISSDNLFSAIGGWSETLFNYYYNQLKVQHDYRAFPVILKLGYLTGLLAGNDHLSEIMSAMTFRLLVETKFDAKWVYGDADNFNMGHVEQNGNVSLSYANKGYWGDYQDLSLKYTDKCSFTFHSGQNATYQAPNGLTYLGTVWLMNWDPCIANTFDMQIADFDGAEITSSNHTMHVAAASASVCFKDFRWPGAGMAYIFPVPIHNKNATLGDTTYEATGTAAENKFTGSGLVHITIKHTP